LQDPLTQRNQTETLSSKGIMDLGPLGHELEQLEKPPNQGRLKRVLGVKSPTKEVRGPHT
jgi:hypothetical protein